ncbi:LarC family nickel insertion protein [Pseudooceanicola sp. C21-150M6]|uniref:LarC family nickel insertion protein n=1 Tax=Pseudooceanicola sp. C21-150M6 TaxID=3434355 RepID=UPI003D7FED88
MTMSRHIHLDPVGGLAGDMFIAALLATCPELTGQVMAEIAAALPDGIVAGLEPGTSGGLRVQRFRVTLPEQDHQPRHAHDHPHHHEDFRSIAERLKSAPLDNETRRHALAILTRIAEAEAEVHGVPLDEVHFHELADWDSLADVVGAGAIIGALDGAGWSIGPLPLGGGLVRTAHGRLPVPAPATTLLLRGLPVTDDRIAGERVTPTGAAIAAHLSDGLLKPRPAQARMGSTGMGAGTRDLPDRPNILRAFVLDVAEPPDDRTPSHAHRRTTHAERTKP